MSNKDFFRDNTIVPFWDKDAMREERGSDAYASRLSKGVTDIMYKVSMENIDINPNSVDHLIKGYGTYMGNLGLVLSDIGRDDSRNKPDWRLSGFVKESPIANSKDYAKLTKLLKKMKMASGTTAEKLKAMQRAYYKEEDAAKKTAIKKQIYAYVKEVLPRAEDKYKRIKDRK